MSQSEGNVIPYNWSGTLGPMYNVSFTEVVPLLIDTCHKKFMNQDLKGQFVHREGNQCVLAHARKESLERPSKIGEVCIPMPCTLLTSISAWSDELYAHEL